MKNILEKTIKTENHKKLNFFNNIHILDLN